VDVPTFQIAFPVFRTTDARYLAATLARASRMVSPVVWGPQTDDGIGLLCAAYLIEDPFGTTTALKPGVQCEYRVQYEAMKRAVIGGGFGVAGGFCGNGWCGGGGLIP
jgi:hypothetical protein